MSQERIRFKKNEVFSPEIPAVTCRVDDQLDIMEAYDERRVTGGSSLSYCILEEQGYNPPEKNGWKIFGKISPAELSKLHLI